MKKILVILILAILSVAIKASELKRCVELEKQIQGDWIAAEYYVSQPPPELQQSIKTMSFQADNIIEWEYVQDGKMHKAKGRYGIYSFPTDQKELRRLPDLIVAPTIYSDALLSSNVILTLSDFELDFDSRFLQSWGKLIKATGQDGKRVLFIRKQKKISRR